MDTPDWTKEELEKLVQHQQQAGLFENDDAREITTLRKLPYAFYYTYECNVGGETRRYRHKIADWEAGALYWNCRRSHGAGWEAPFRAKLEKTLPNYDIQFLMGTIHRFPNQWLIFSLIYPPKLAVSAPMQAELVL